MTSLCTKIFVASWAMCVTIIVTNILGITLNPNFIFVTYIYYNILKVSIGSQFSLAIVLFFNMKNALDRIETFFRCFSERETFSPDITAEVNKTRVSINLRNVSVKWNSLQEDKCLMDVDFTAESKGLTVLIGSSGSGKSALLLTILKETCVVQGNLAVEGKMSYASQDPWIFPASIRQNILFTEQFEEDKFWRVVNVCGLEHDLQLFPHGDLSLVGERGVLLSGGQKARINLARAVYKEADIYLLDDPLSAVDFQVSRHIFERCILNYLGDKVVILVTHQVHILPMAERIFSVENGRVKRQVSSNQLANTTNALKLQAMQDQEEEEKKKLNMKNIKLQKKIYEQDQSLEVIKSIYHFFTDAKIYYTCILLIVVCIGAQFLINAGDFFMNFWINLSQREHQNTTSNGMPVESESFFTTEVFLYIYAGIVVSGGLVTIARTILFEYCSHKSSEALHRLALQRIMRATMNFFNIQESGMILNKFSADMVMIDQYFPVYLVEVVQNIFFLIGTIALICVINYLCLIPSGLYVAFLLFLMFRLLPVLDEIKIQEILKRSPMFTHIVVSMQGAITIRALNANDLLIKEFDKLQSKNCVALYIKIVISFLAAFFIDFLCVVYMALVLFFFYYFQTELQIGNIGTIVVQIISLVSVVQTLVRLTSELTMATVSLSRIQEMKTVPIEADDGHLVPSESWPNEGRIKFDSLCLQYSPSSPVVLKNINIEINPKEKIGIIGRTGSGKSSLISTLFRLYDFTGTIKIDGIDIKEISLKDLRSNITIIPQNPILFVGTLRRNLDPFKEHSDEQIWHALGEVDMKKIISELPNSLETLVEESGSNFSCGQRQLLCLVRALLKKSQILILDEVTANIDLKTDKIMQTTIRKNFSNSTLLTIAHRLYTVIDSDKMLVLHNGSVVEFDHPHQLLQNPDGYFYNQIHQNGKEIAEELTQLAHVSFLEKHPQQEAIETESVYL